MYRNGVKLLNNQERGISDFTTMTPHVAFSNIFKLSFRNIASHVQQGLYRNNVYCKINKFKEHKTISLFNKMAFYSTGQDQEKISRNFMVIF